MSPEVGPLAEDTQPVNKRMHDGTSVCLHRWVGDATKVQALAKTVVKTRTHGETGEPAHVQIPDHLDVLAELACGAQAHIVISDVTGD